MSSSIEKQNVHIVRFKKNLRVLDNQALFCACQNSKSVIWMYCFETEIMSLPDYSNFHTKAIHESLIQLKKNLLTLNIPLLIYKWNICETFEFLLKHCNIWAIYSQEETWNRATFQRDLEIIKRTKQSGIQFFEYPNNWVVRKLKNRDNRTDIRNERIRYWEIIPVPQQQPRIILPDILYKNEFTWIQKLYEHVLTAPYKIIISWEDNWHKVLDNFLNKRSQNYMYHISRPFESQTSCSRLST